jgi:hypothetical protein
MVARGPILPRLRAGWREESGAVLIEGLIIFPVLLLTIAAFIDFAVVMYKMNQTLKAQEIGARLLAVSDPVVTDFATLIADFGVEEGGAVPDTPLAVSCGMGAAACDPVGLQRLMSGSDGVCAPDHGGGVAGICDFAPRLTANDVRITYHRTALGYVGRNAPPVVLITLETRPIDLGLPLLGALIGRERLELPVKPVTVMGEDLTSCKHACP